MKLENVRLDAAGPGQEDHGRQGQHDDRRRAPASTSDVQKRDRADSQARSKRPTSDYDREKFQERLAKLTGGVAIISVGAEHRSRHEAEEGPRRRRAARDAGGRRRRHSARRRRGPAALHAKRSKRPALAPRATRRSASTSCCSVLDAPLQADRRQLRPRRHAWSPTKSARSRPTSATTPTPASTSTWSRPASSTRRRSCARALSNAASIAGLMLTTEALVTNFDKDDKDKKRVEGSIR